MYANIEIANGKETIFVRQGLEKQAFLRTKCVVDFSTTILCINETIKNELKFPIIEKKNSNERWLIERV